MRLVIAQILPTGNISALRSTSFDLLKQAQKAKEIERNIEPKESVPQQAGLDVLALWDRKKVS